jgi:transcriptional regulatory protein LevR
MTNTNINIFKDLNNSKPKPVIQTVKNINNVSSKIILEVINEIKSNQDTNKNLHHINDSILKDEIETTNENLINTPKCTYGVTIGFCKCCGNFTESGLRRRRFH